MEITNSSMRVSNREFKASRRLVIAVEPSRACISPWTLTKLDFNCELKVLFGFCQQLRVWCKVSPVDLFNPIWEADTCSLQSERIWRWYQRARCCWTTCKVSNWWLTSSSFLTAFNLCLLRFNDGLLGCGSSRFSKESSLDSSLSASRKMSHTCSIASSGRTLGMRGPSANRKSDLSDEMNSLSPYTEAHLRRILVGACFNRL